MFSLKFFHITYATLFFYYYLRTQTEKFSMDLHKDDNINFTNKGLRPGLMKDSILTLSLAIKNIYVFGNYLKIIYGHLAFIIKMYTLFHIKIVVLFHF